jgi:hypothetical protein
VCAGWQGFGVERELNSNLRFVLNEYPDTHLSLSCYSTLRAVPTPPNTLAEQTVLSYKGGVYLKRLPTEAHLNYSRTALIRFNWDGEPSGNAEHPDNWIFH